MSLAPIAVKFGLREAIDPIPLLTMRFWVGAAVLWVCLLVFDPAVLKIRPRAIFPVFLVSAFFATAYVLYYLSLTYIDASIAHMLVSVNPTVVLFLLFLSGRRIGLNSLARLVLVLTGLYFLVGPSGSLNFMGVLLALGMTVFYGAFLFFVEKWLADVPSMTVTVYVDTFVAILLSIVYIFLYRTWQPMSVNGWEIVAFTGLLSTALAHFLFVSSVKAIGSGETALINPFETVFTVIWAMIFLGERLSQWQWLGGGLILVSAFLIGRQIAVPKKADIAA